MVLNDLVDSFCYSLKNTGLKALISFCQGPAGIQQLVGAPGMGLRVEGAKPPKCRLAGISPHREIVRLRIRGPVVRKFSNFDRFCSQNW